jgi:type I restriction enzyme S subunit
MNSVRLGDHVKFLSGFAFKSKLFNDDGLGLPVVRIRDVVRGHSETFYSGEYDDRYVVERGEYLIGMDGEFNLARWRSDRALLNQRVCKVDSLSDDVDRDYLAKFLPVALKAIEDATPFVTVKHLSVKTLNEVQIPLPPLDEQKRIAAILDAADELRAKRRASLALLDDLLQSTFLDMFGDPVTNPMGWDERQFGDIATETKIGLVRSSKEFGADFTFPYVRMDAVTVDGRFLPEKVLSTDADDEEADAFALRKGDFLFNTRNSKELVGKVCVFPGPEGWLFNNNLMRVRFSEGIEPSFVARQFRFSRVQRELEKRKSGTTNVFAVYWKSLQTLPVLVAPPDLQQRFATIVESVEQQKARYQAHLDELDTLFASLQSRAFKGEL